MPINHDSFYYQYLDLPKVPDDMVQSLLNFAHDPIRCNLTTSMSKNKPEKGKNYLFRTLNVYGTISQSRSVIRFDLEPEVHQWVKSNIADNFIDTCLATYFAANEDDYTNGLHSDISREYVLMYLLETGNPDQKTAWWREIGQPLIRDMATLLDNFDSVELLEETVFEKNKWAILNASILHSIHNIQGNRIALQVSFTKEQAEKFLNDTNN